MMVDVYRVRFGVMVVLIVPIEVTNLCVVPKHNLTVPMEDVLILVRYVMKAMTVGTTAMKLDVQVDSRKLLLNFIGILD